MKKTGILAVFLVFVSQIVFAEDLAETRKAIFKSFESCGQAVFSDSEWFAASLRNTVNGIGHVRLQSLTDTRNRLDLPASDTVVDVKIQNGNVYILTETSFEAWNIATPRPLFNYRSHPRVTKASHWGEKARKPRSGVSISLI